MMARVEPEFDVAAFLANAGLGRRIVRLEPKETFFTQGEPADSVFYLQTGRARVTVVSTMGKEATITLLEAGDFIGEESLVAPTGLRLATATAVTACVALKIARDEMIRVMHEEHNLSDMFLKFLLAQHPHPGRSCRSTFQFQREAPGAGSAADGGNRPGRRSGSGAA